MLSLLILLPLLGFTINGLWYLLSARQEAGQVHDHKHGHGDSHHHASSKGPGIIASLAIGIPFLLALGFFSELKTMPADGQVITQTLFNWIAFGNFSLDFTLRLDALSGLFVLLITGVGTLIHIYSIGYMSHDATPRKFFAYLNLFCAAMLVLVLGGSLLVMFMGWEGVGLCSYLLIGYWYSDEDKAIAGKKAFIVNRIGDFGFILGMFMLFSLFGTLDFFGIIDTFKANGADQTLLTITCLCLFLGCTGKSAQFPLYVWLPDAMAGPTPVSALIHAATMVTSGIYLLARLNVLIVASPTAMTVIAVVGVFTALGAATIAIAQTDIKKVLAYSTVSQLGYMFLACGVGAFGSGVFHVLTHGVFKALLFMGAGAVIHSMHEEQNIQKMGGLKKQLPKTHLIFVVGWLAICGIPPFAGFFSKDEILWMSLASPHGSPILTIVGVITAFLTAFYMTRLMALTFWGKARFKEDKHHAVHESPAVMLIPLFILAALSAVIGLIGIPHMNWIAEWLSPVVAEIHEYTVSESLETILMIISVASAIIAMIWAAKIYSKPQISKAGAPSGLNRILINKWYVDELYDKIIVQPMKRLATLLWKRVDEAFIDRIMVGFGRVSVFSGERIRLIQTGSIQHYMFVLAIGLAITTGWIIYGLL